MFLLTWLPGPSRVIWFNLVAQPSNTVATTTDGGTDNCDFCDYVSSLDATACIMCIQVVFFNQ